jgi:hypothetical protein
LYSLFDGRGTDPSGPTMDADTSRLTPYLDTKFFQFVYGNVTGERIIDSQYASSTQYVGKGARGFDKLFGVNFADGRIKGYPTTTGPSGAPFTAYVRYVRGNPDYGTNIFVDRENGTVADEATGLVWTAADSGRGLDWTQALAYCESLTTAGAADWRLPDAKELQTLVDYRRSPATSHSAAIDPVFQTTAIRNEAGAADYPAYWTSTTHAASNGGGPWAAYVAFGRAMGFMNGAWLDVHGAGAQRSDPKTGDPDQYPTGHGPQGDAVRVLNFARCVRGGAAVPNAQGGPVSTRPPVVLDTAGPGPQQPAPGPQQPSPGPQQPGPGQPPPGGDGQTPPGLPPPGAVTACSGKSTGAPCGLVTPGGPVTGTCRLVATQLACVPAGMAPPR